MAANEQDTNADAGKAVSMQDLKPPASSGQMGEVAMGFASLQSFELMQRAAKLLAASSLVPQRYQGNLANCVIALNMSQRIGADPLMVMQNLYVVHGNPSWSGQFVIACFNQCGRFSAMRYRWFNKPEKPGDIPDDWGCQAYATEFATGETIEGPLITIAMAKAEGWYQKKDSKWQTIPELMLMYRAGAWLQRTHAPDISMGLRTAEETHDVYEARRGADGSYEVTLDSLRAVDEQAPGASADGAPAGETVDTETGEVSEPSAAAEPQQSAIPQYDEGAALALLQAKKKLATLDEAWQAITQDFADTDREIPDTVSAKYREMREALAEKEAEL